MERLYKTNKCDNCFYHEEHYLGMEGTVDICYAQKRNEFLGGVVLNHTYKNNIKCDKYENTIQHYKKIDKKLKKYDKLEEENRKLNDKIIDLSADLGMYQNENLSLTKDIEKYWQFENQIKLPLNVFSKVLEDFGIVDEYGMGCQITGIGIDGDGSLYWIAVNGDQYDFKDYQKTWFLKGEKDEIKKTN